MDSERRDQVRMALAIGEAVADLPLGIDATLVSDQPVVVKTAIGEWSPSGRRSPSSWR
jgi:hypothetical protein